MGPPIAVALLGFGADERLLLASRLGIDPRRQPAYRHVLDIDEARFVVADIDQPGVSDLLETVGRAGDSIAVGARRPTRAAAWMPRPIDPAKVLGALDRLVAMRDVANRVADPASSPPAAPVTPDLAAARRSDAAASRQRREAALRPVGLRHALLVDDSEVALAFLERHLQRYDITADWAMTSGKALQLLSQRSYGIVFLDIDLGDDSELDGLSLCQSIKRRHVDPGSAVPVAVLVSALNDPADRVRGRLAGADGYIGKPLDEAELDRVLTSHGLGIAGERPRPRSP